MKKYLITLTLTVSLFLLTPNLSVNDHVSAKENKKDKLDEKITTKTNSNGHASSSPPASIVPSPISSSRPVSSSTQGPNPSVAPQLSRGKAPVASANIQSGVSKPAQSGNPVVSPAPQVPQSRSSGRSLVTQNAYTKVLPDTLPLFLSSGTLSLKNFYQSSSLPATVTQRLFSAGLVSVFLGFLVLEVDQEALKFR